MRLAIQNLTIAPRIVFGGTALKPHPNSPYPPAVKPPPPLARLPPRNTHRPPPMIIILYALSITSAEVDKEVVGRGGEWVGGFSWKSLLEHSLGNYCGNSCGELS